MAGGRWVDSGESVGWGGEAQRRSGASCGTARACVRVQAALPKPTMAPTHAHTRTHAPPQIFETGVDEMSWDDLSKNDMLWPALREVTQYRRTVYRLIRDLLATHPALEDGAEVTWVSVRGGREGASPPTTCARRARSAVLRAGALLRVRRPPPCMRSRLRAARLPPPARPPAHPPTPVAGLPRMGRVHGV